MAELLLINPRKRRAPAKKRATRARARRRNPVRALAVAAPKRAVRRRNPIGLGRVAKRVHRRRRNPIGGLNTNSIMNTLKGALMGGAGAVAVDVMMGQIIPFLPVSMQPTAAGDTTVGVYDAVKLAATIAAGELLNKPTKGLSRKLAQGSLTVQAYQVLSTFVPATMTLGAVGYMNPGAVVNGSNRLRTNMSRMAAYNPPGSTPLLSAYQQPGTNTSLLNGASRSRQREGITIR
jgi:hypothetical protein